MTAPWPSPRGNAAGTRRSPCAGPTAGALVGRRQLPLGMGAPDRSNPPWGPVVTDTRGISAMTVRGGGLFVFQGWDGRQLGFAPGTEPATGAPLWLEDGGIAVPTARRDEHHLHRLPPSMCWDFELPRGPAWSVVTPLERPQLSCLPGGPILAAGRSAVALHEATTGAERWRHDFRSDDVSVALHADGSVSVGTVEEVSVSFDSEDYEFSLVRIGPRGTVAGRYAPGLQGDNGPYDVVALDDGRTLFLHAGRAMVLDSGTAPVWSADVATPLGKRADRVGIAEPAVAASGDILLAADGGVVCCLDPAGKVRWVTEVTPGVPLLDPMVDARGACYVCARDGTVAAVDGDGSVVFRLATDTDPSALSMAGDGVAVLATREREVLFIG